MSIPQHWLGHRTGAAGRCRGTIPGVTPPRTRFEGAITTPEMSGLPSDASAIPAPVRPRRPLLLEFAAACLVVGGLTGLLGILGSPERDGTGLALDSLLIGLNILTIIVGLLVRAGRAWVLALNVVAVVLFLEVTALPSGVAIVFATLDTVVLFALIRHRGWFDASTWATPADNDPSTRPTPVGETTGPPR